MVNTGIPDGANELAKVTRPRNITIRGDGGGSVGDEEGNSASVSNKPMPDSIRKGATGKPFNAPAVPLEGGSQDAEKYGLGRGKFGANTGVA